MEPIDPARLETLHTAAFSYTRWREQFIKVILIAGTILGFFAALSSGLDIVHNGNPILAVVYALAWVVILVVTVGRWPYWAKAGVFLFLLYALGISGLLENGMRGDARIFFLTFITMTALMVNPKMGIASFGLSLVTIIATGVLVFTGQIKLISKTTPAGSPELWVVSTMSLILLSTAVLTGLSLFLREFDAAQKRVRQVVNEVFRLNSELEQRVAERTAQLQAANQGLEAFSYSVSHDLQAPLRAVNGYIGMLWEDFPNSLDPQAGNYLNKIRDNTAKMSRLIEDLLKFSRIGRQEIKMEPVDLTRLAQSTYNEIIEQQRSNRQVEFNLAVLPVVQGDPGLLRQVFANLISNAIKFSRDCPQARIDIGCEQQNGEDVLFIRDNGAGFNMEYAGNLFGVFQRFHTENEFEGSGVGLAIVQQIVQKHGGRIWAEAEVGKGAAFYFTLQGQAPA